MITTLNCVLFSGREGVQQVSGARSPIARRNALLGTRSRRLTIGGKCARARVESKAASACARRPSLEHVFTAKNAHLRTASWSVAYGTAAKSSQTPHLQQLVAGQGQHAEALDLVVGMEAGLPRAVEGRKWILRRRRRHQGVHTAPEGSAERGHQQEV